VNLKKLSLATWIPVIAGAIISTRPEPMISNIGAIMWMTGVLLQLFIGLIFITDLIKRRLS